MAGYGRYKIRDLTGQRFGRWLILSRDGSDKHGNVTWNCQCDCGTIKVLPRSRLTSKRHPSRSCGCLHKESTIQSNIRRGEERRRNRTINKVAFLRNQLRKAFLKWPARSEALISARTARGVYTCAGYHKEAHSVRHRDGIAVDHIDPIGKLEDWNTWIDRLFCGTENLQLLCKSCHKEKTADERKQREAKAKDRRRKDTQCCSKIK